MSKTKKQKNGSLAVKGRKGPLHGTRSYRVAHSTSVLSIWVLNGFMEQDVCHGPPKEVLSRPAPSVRAHENVGLMALQGTSDDPKEGNFWPEGAFLVNSFFEN